MDGLPRRVPQPPRRKAAFTRTGQTWGETDAGPLRTARAAEHRTPPTPGEPHMLPTTPVTPPARPARPEVHHEAGVWIVGWHRNVDSTIGGTRVNDPKDRLAKLSGRRVRVFCYLRQEAPERPARLTVVNARKAKPTERNDLNFKLTGVLIRHDTSMGVVRVEVCPDGTTTPFTIGMLMTRGASKMISSDTYTITARGGQVSGAGLVIDTLEAVHAPVPERWKPWRGQRRQRNHARKQATLQRRQATQAADQQTRDQQTRDQQKVPPAQPPVAAANPSRWNALLRWLTLKR